jgi:hypothetical protein
MAALPDPTATLKGVDRKTFDRMVGLVQRVGVGVCGRRARRSPVSWMATIGPRAA